MHHEAGVTGPALDVSDHGQALQSFFDDFKPHAWPVGCKAYFVGLMVLFVVAVSHLMMWFGLHRGLFAFFVGAEVHFTAIRTILKLPMNHDDLDLLKRTQPCELDFSKGSCYMLGCSYCNDSTAK